MTEYAIIATVEGVTQTVYSVPTVDAYIVVLDPNEAIEASVPVITSGGPDITTSTLPDATKSSVYSVTLAAFGGITPYTWVLAAGSLPTGLSLSSAGVISGTPTNVSTSSFTVTVTDAVGRTATRGFTLAVVAAGGGGLPNTDHGPRFNDWVANKTTGTGGDYADGDVWMPAGTYYCDPFDLSTSTYVRAFDAAKPNNNWLTFKEFDGPGTVVFDLRPESAAAHLGQTQSQAYNDTAHGGAFANVLYTAGSVRWCFDGAFRSQDGSIHARAGSSVFGTPGMDRVIFHGTSHQFTVEEWKRQFDILCGLRGIPVVSSIPNDSASWRGLGGTGSSDGPYFSIYDTETRFKNNNQPAPFRLDGVTKFAILRADVGPCGDDDVFVGAGTDHFNLIGSVMHEAGDHNGSALGPATNWFHPDTLQITGSINHSNVLDCTHQGHFNIAAEAGDVSNLIIDRVWQGDCGITGGSLYVSGHTMGSTNKWGSGGPTTRLSGHFYKGFSNGTGFNDGGAQVGRDDASSGSNTWHAVLTDYGGHSASLAITLAVPSGVTVNPTTGFMTTSLAAFLANVNLPHNLFKAAYATTELAAVMTDYSIAFD